MKLLALTVLLAVMQAAPPVPRQTANNPTGAAANVQSKSTADQAQPAPSPASLKADSNGPTNADSGEQHHENAEHPVSVTKLPPVTLNPSKRDAADWGYWAFSLLLVAVGFLQVWLLYHTLVAIRRQAHEMRRQRHEMRRQRLVMSSQFETMKAQLQEMQDASQQSDRLIEQAAKQAEQLTAVANAGKLSAEAAQQNIELIIRKERARLIFEIGNPPKRSIGHQLHITFTVQHDGTTAAFNVESQTNAIVSDSYDSPKNEFIKLPIGLPNVVSPSYGTKLFSRPLVQMGDRWGLTMDEETLKRIAGKEMFIHFWGFIKYTDFFDRTRETTFRYRLVAGVDEESIEYWQPYGQTGDNRQT
jgi:hypothetical protein